MFVRRQNEAALFSGLRRSGEFPLGFLRKNADSVAAPRISGLRRIDDPVVVVDCYDSAVAAPISGLTLTT